MQREVRFALVMYGGVSLAVYMNGVTQEFFHLVRATASNAPDPAGTEAIYRELARIAKSRFVVDIVSGSSAGGINAIFLAKALSNGQDLNDLSRLWLDQADLRCLWNKSPFPKSLLSGQAMDGILLRALEAMDKRGGPGPLQSEMDVFITATDIQGLELPLPLADEAVAEKRHKNVFHFQFAAGGDNDFSREANPRLAFAGRATSSFPVAFEPARLVDYPAAQEAAKLFPDYVAAGADFTHRAFGDGGYLNNKPFSHVLEEIPRRVGDLPVRRMLVYVEPTPERAAGNATKASPGPLRNSIEALITLHQYETIREDLQKVLDRNRLIERVREATAQVDRDVENWRGAGVRSQPRLPGAEYARRKLSDETHARGPGYAGYHRLKVRAVTEELAGLLGLPREAVESWRRGAFDEEDPSRSENRFLLHFDLGYRRRRLRFLLAKVDLEDRNETCAPQSLRQELSWIARTLERLNFVAGDCVGIDAGVAAIREAFAGVMIPAAEQVEHCLAGHPLKQYFDRYEDYDQVTFPMLYETQVGEAEPVEVFRVSPLDARGILDESSPAERRRKLAGTAWFHFGAFLKRGWRENDMLWGRLDGAERIVDCVLPSGSPDRARLVREAHLAILRESFGDRAEAVYRSLQAGYEVDRRLGFVTGVRMLARVLWITLKMLLSMPLSRVVSLVASLVGRPSSGL